VEEGFNMSIPGFTAEAALRDAGERQRQRQYRTPAFGQQAEDPSLSRAVVPQIRRFFVFPGPDGTICLGFEDYVRGISYVAGCF
jgi:hypothetical protein